MNSNTTWMSRLMVMIITLRALSVLQANEPIGFDGNNPANSAPEVRWPAPTLTDENLTAWQTFIQPSPEELRWRNIRWHTSLASAIEEANRLQRPILLWTMNGNPCGET